MNKQTEVIQWPGSLTETDDRWNENRIRTDHFIAQKTLNISSGRPRVFPGKFLVMKRICQKIISENQMFVRD